MSILDRSVSATLLNLSSHDLVLEATNLESGSMNPGPPERVPAKTEARWFTANDTFMHGVAGEVTYRIEALGAKLVLGWSNPFIGDNAFTQRFEAPGEGASRYVPFDPMHPEGVAERPYDERLARDEALRDDEAIEVTYRFVCDEPKAREDEGHRDDAIPVAPSTEAPKPVAHVGTTRTAVRDDGIGPRQIVYLRLNDLQAVNELAALRKAIKAPSNECPSLFGAAITASMDNRWQLRGPLDASSPPPAQPPLLTSSEADAVRALLARRDDVVKVTKGSDGPRRRESSIVAMAHAFASATRDLERFDAGEVVTHQPMRRLVLSAHHCPSFTNDRPDVLWGGTQYSSAFLREFTLYESLRELCRIFPRAAAQVEDLMFGACYTGMVNPAWGDWVIAPRFAKPDLFPNLQTLWGYAEIGPSGEYACQDMVRWAGATHVRGDIPAILKARNAAKRGAVYWRRSGDTMTPILGNA
jgi:hypothetical protein